MFGMNFVSTKFIIVLNNIIWGLQWQTYPAVNQKKGF